MEQVERRETRTSQGMSGKCKSLSPAGRWDKASLLGTLVPKSMFVAVMQQHDAIETVLHRCTLQDQIVFPCILIWWGLPRAISSRTPDPEKLLSPPDVAMANLAFASRSSRFSGVTLVCLPGRITELQGWVLRRSRRYSEVPDNRLYGGVPVSKSRWPEMTRLIGFLPLHPDPGALEGEDERTIQPLDLHRNVDGHKHAKEFRSLQRRIPPLGSSANLTGGMVCARRPCTAVPPTWIWVDGQGRRTDGAGNTTGRPVVLVDHPMKGRATFAARWPHH
ncbi:hypothetical protein BO71DRAFT_255561 [Aspergillus ellipticus CBS 707.79]|uniref:Uncharacterized protein n=1 Tax=Aspergillus ellipticus CBS 707.79 TaxID=1448320 RepID=A0A319D884_9EURO|nr:hypothetical protein BO71DRAFT_255561 [Aspergillus ellipticus CBS 707.79]